MLGTWVFPKLAVASLLRFPEAAYDELVASTLSHVPGLKKVMEGAPVWGGGNFDSFLHGLRQASTRGFLDGLQAIREGHTEFSRYPSERRELVKAFTGLPADVANAWRKRGYRAGWEVAKTLTAHLSDVVGGTGNLAGSLHDAIKAPAVRLMFEKSFHASLKWEAAHGGDPTDAQVIQRSYTRAVVEALRAKLQADNPGLTGLRAGLSVLDQKMFGGSEVARTAAGVAAPIQRVPSNLIGQAMERIFGSVTGLVGQGKEPGALRVLREGVDNFTPDQKDLIARRLVKGVGAIPLLALTGYFLGSAISGGIYIPGYSRRKKDTEPAYGSTLGSTLVGHTPAGLVVNYAATVGMLQAEWERKYNHGTITAFSEAAAAATFAGLMDEQPIFQMVNEFRKLGTPQGQGEKVESLTTPLVLRQSKAGKKPLRKQSAGFGSFR